MADEAPDLNKMSQPQLLDRLYSNPTVGKPEWHHDDVEPNSTEGQARVNDFLATHARAGRTWQETREHLQDRFPEVAPYKVQGDFDKMGQALKLQAAHEKYAGMEETDASRLSRHSLPVVSWVREFNRSREYGAAKQRLEAGPEQTRPEDYDTIANYEKVAQEEKKRNESWGGAIATGAEKLPALVGDFAAGGYILKSFGLAGQTAAQAAVNSARAAVPVFSSQFALNALKAAPGVARQAGLVTATVPSLWAERMVHNNIEAGRDPLAVKGFPAAFATGMIQMAILGQVSNFAAGKLPQEGMAAFLGRTGIKGTLGSAEAAAADVLTGATGLDGHYGPLADMWQGKWGEGLKHATVTAMTFAALGTIHEGMHGTPAMQKAALQPYLDTLETLQRQGLSADAAGKVLIAGQEPLVQLLRRNPSPSKTEALDAARTLPAGPARQWAEQLASQLPEEKPAELPPSTGATQAHSDAALASLTPEQQAKEQAQPQAPATAPRQPQPAERPEPLPPMTPEQKDAWAKHKPLRPLGEKERREAAPAGQEVPPVPGSGLSERTPEQERQMAELKEVEKQRELQKHEQWLKSQQPAGTAAEIRQGFEGMGQAAKEAGEARARELVEKQGYVGFRKPAAAEAFAKDHADWTTETVDGETRFRPPASRKAPVPSEHDLDRLQREQERLRGMGPLPRRQGVEQPPAAGVDTGAAAGGKTREAGPTWFHTGTKFRENPAGYTEFAARNGSVYKIGAKFTGEKGDVLLVKAFDQHGHEVGDVLFDRKEPGSGKNYRTPAVTVAEGHRRRGIAEAMYDFATEELRTLKQSGDALGGELEPTVKGQAEGGKGLWTKNAARRAQAAVKEGRLARLRQKQQAQGPVAARGTSKPEEPVEQGHVAESKPAEPVPIMSATRNGILDQIARGEGQLQPEESAVLRERLLFATGFRELAEEQGVTQTTIKNREIAGLRKLGYTGTVDELHLQGRAAQTLAEVESRQEIGGQDLHHVDPESVSHNSRINQIDDAVQKLDKLLKKQKKERDSGKWNAERERRFLEESRGFREIIDGGHTEAGASPRQPGQAPTVQAEQAAGQEGSAAQPGAAAAGEELPRAPGAATDPAADVTTPSEEIAEHGLLGALLKGKSGALDLDQLGEASKKVWEWVKKQAGQGIKRGKQAMEVGEADLLPEVFPAEQHPQLKGKLAKMQDFTEPGWYQDGNGEWYFKLNTREAAKAVATAKGTGFRGRFDGVEYEGKTPLDVIEQIDARMRAKLAEQNPLDIDWRPNETIPEDYYSNASTTPETQQQAGTIANFLHDDGGFLDTAAIGKFVAGVKDRLVSAVKHVGFELAELRGKMFPRTAAKSPEAADTIARFVSAAGYVKLAAPEMIDRVMGKDATPEQRLLLCTSMAEERCRTARYRYTEKSRLASNAAADARGAAERELDPVEHAAHLAEAARQARKATEYMHLAQGVKTFVGDPDYPLPDEAALRKVWASPDYKTARQGWETNMRPFMERNYRASQGLADGEPIDSLSQIAEIPMNFLVGMPGSRGQPVAGGGKGNLKNPKQVEYQFAKEAKLNADKYDTDMGSMIENSMGAYKGAMKAAMYRGLVDSGLAQWGKRGAGYSDESGVAFKELPGVNPPQGTQAAEPGETSLYVHPDSYHDVRRALEVDRPIEPGTVKAFNGALTKAALASTVEMVSHGKNLLTFLFKPGVNPLDVMTEGRRILARDPDTMKRLTELARIGAMKVEKGFESAEGQAEGKWDKYNPLHYGAQVLDFLQQTMRLVGENAYDRLVRSGRVEASETGKRDFINQLGQYNRAGQQKYVALLRDTGWGPFATAGTNYYMQGLSSLVGAPGVKGATAGHQVGLHAEVLGRIALVAGTAALVNYLAHGRVDGSDDTPLGAIKLGDSNGKTIYYDLTNLTGLTRGMRATGLMALSEGMRRGDTAGQIFDKGFKQAGQAVLHPAEGPAVSFLHTALTGENTIGMPLARKAMPWQSQSLNNLTAALMNANPAIGMGFGFDNPKGEHTELSRAWKALGPFGPKERGKGEKEEPTEAAREEKSERRRLGTELKQQRRDRRP